MDKIKIIFDITDFARKNEMFDTLTINGKFNLKIGNRNFPSEDWQDYPFLVMSMWMEDMKIFFDKGQTELTFMEGPYSIQLSKINSSLSEINIIIRGKREFLNKNIIIINSDFIHELINVSGLLIDKIKPYISDNGCIDFDELNINRKKLLEYKIL